MASFSPGLSTIFPLPPFCFIEYSVNAPASTHVSTRAERNIFCDYMRVFSPSARDEHFQPGQKPSPCNRHFNFKGISFRTRSEISARLTGLFSKSQKSQPRFWKKSPCNESGDYMKKVSTRAENPSPVSKKRARIFSPGWQAEKPHVIAAKFQPGLKRELGLAQWWNIQRNKMAAMEKLCFNLGWK